MSGLQDAARGLVVLKVLGDAVKDQSGVVRPLTAEAFAEVGAAQVKPTLDDGTPLGSVSLASPKETPRVTDEAAFLAWVEEEHPGELVKTVRDSFRTAILAQIKTTGELPPGVEMRTGQPYLTVRLAPGAKEAVIGALRSGALPLAITAGGGS